jgi:hypothetical protein
MRSIGCLRQIATLCESRNQVKARRFQSAARLPSSVTMDLRGEQIVALRGSELSSDIDGFLM